ncbi:GNAT family N-acetyltransferase [Sphingomonas sp.]|uniref:GNAT family N-acetyltransferase n=1 Tax=Sphingomonas sp. TaxID=28214 RepID=UPI001EC795F3|nr:GNAT family N-acetyltransferase [Sphingomonas sp.]MBX3595340.1 GNAT family N-acetyltransferase [Sphingomonas sp.]
MATPADAPRLRTARAADFDPLGRVMFDAVHGGDSPYDAGQRAAWVAEPRRGEPWHARLAAQHVVLAEDAHGAPVGFMSLAAGGYIDFAYILPGARGTGLFRRLLTAIEEVAQHAGARRLWVHASLMAEPAFAASGFVVLDREEVTIGDQRLARCTMERAG